MDLRRVLRALRRVVLVALAIVLLAAGTLAFLRWRGYLLDSQQANPEQWEVFGVDVSSYQGVVDWAVLADQGVQFAFIKATEGSGMQDAQFTANWTGALQAGVRPGAYHFFSYDSPGETQADNFIAQVPVTEGALPPVVDLEFYGKYLEQPAGREETLAILNPLLQRLEEHYGVKPILYVTYRSYYRYLAGGGYGDYPLWFSSPVVVPLSIGGWEFWQYSHSARLSGYYGSEGRIDLNVFHGTREQFARFGNPA
jgi:lysozyme